MNLPENLISALANTKGFDKTAFEKIHASGEQVTSIRLNPLKTATQFPNLPSGQAGFPIPFSKIPWTEFGYYLESRPSFTFDPLFHAGCYYVQEASSMFLEQALKQTTDLSKPLKVLDLCAAPGGKSTHIQSLVSKESLLVSNEVIRARAGVLKDNIIKWGSANVIVTSNDPKDFARLENYFDVIVADVPCSGSGLFRRDADAIDQWSQHNVALCSQRQQRILADVWPALKKDGILIYSTCSYSKEEDEEIMDWMGRELEIKNKKLEIMKEWGIVETSSANGNTAYRFWPDKAKGEGFFLACFQKEEGEDTRSPKIKSKPGYAGRNETAVVEKWIKTDNLDLIKHLDTVYAWPREHSADFSMLLEQLRVLYSGVLVGELMRDKLVPDHALAMSSIVSDNIRQTELNYEQAIRYLQRKELKIEGKGWQLFTCTGHTLGWANLLPNRVNNYYPKALRILKDI